MMAYERFESAWENFGKFIQFQPETKTLMRKLERILIKLYRQKLLATVVEGDSKAPFSIATTPRCRGGHYSFPWIAPLYPQYIPYNAEC